VPWRHISAKYNWDISPDGRLLAYIDTAHEADRIAILDLDEKHPMPRYVDVALSSPLQTLSWESAGSGFFVSSYQPASGLLFQQAHFSLDGSITPLIDSTSSVKEGADHSQGIAPNNTSAISNVEGWIIPSPDGAHLAIQRFRQVGNIWEVKLQ
jgi:hypothetical protein